MCPPLLFESTLDSQGEEDSSSSITAKETPTKGSTAKDLDALDIISKQVESLTNT